MNLNIKTRHLRYIYQPIKNKKPSIKPTSDYEKILMPMSEIRRNDIDRSLLIAKGGVTQVAIYAGQNKLTETQAVCSKNDHFNRKLGRNVALGKAMKQINVEV